MLQRLKVMQKEPAFWSTTSSHPKGWELKRLSLDTLTDGQNHLEEVVLNITSCLAQTSTKLKCKWCKVM